MRKRRRLRSDHQLTGKTDGMKGNTARKMFPICLFIYFALLYYVAPLRAAGYAELRLSKVAQLYADWKKEIGSRAHLPEREFHQYVYEHADEPAANFFYGCKFVGYDPKTAVQYFANAYLLQPDIWDDDVRCMGVFLERNPNRNIPGASSLQVIDGANRGSVSFGIDSGESYFKRDSAVKNMYELVDNKTVDLLPADYRIKYETSLADNRLETFLIEKSPWRLLDDPSTMQNSSIVFKQDGSIQYENKDSIWQTPDTYRVSGSAVLGMKEGKPYCVWRYENGALRGLYEIWLIGAPTSKPEIKDPIAASKNANTIGYRFYNAKKYSAAIQSFREAITLDPFNTLAHYNLGCVYSLSGEFNQAHTFVGNAYLLDPVGRGKRLKEDQDLAPMWNFSQDYGSGGQKWYEQAFDELIRPLREESVNSKYRNDHKANPTDGEIRKILESSGRKSGGRGPWYLVSNPACMFQPTMRFKSDGTAEKSPFSEEAGEIRWFVKNGRVAIIEKGQTNIYQYERGVLRGVYEAWVNYNTEPGFGHGEGD